MVESIQIRGLECYEGRGNVRHYDDRQTDGPTDRQTHEELNRLAHCSHHSRREQRNLTPQFITKREWTARTVSATPWLARFPSKVHEEASPDEKKLVSEDVLGAAGGGL